MPLLGFLGFPPFALECWILYHLLRALVGRLRLLPGHAVLYMATVVFCVLMYRQIDAHTVVRFAENISRSLGLWARG
jgi:hypothetical protein